MSEQLVNILDIDSLIYVVCHNKKEDPIKSLSECFMVTDIFLQSIFRDTLSTHYLMYLTVGEGYRKKINPLYKSNRKGEKPEMFDFVKEYLITKYKAQYKLGFEADDLCVSSKKILNSQGVKCFISSPDKDIKMLVGTAYDYKKKEWIQTNEEQAAFNYWGKLISGDPGDGILGLKGKGWKYVEQLFLNTHWNNYALKVFEAYCNYYTQDEAIDELYKVKQCLKILDKIPEFELPELQEIKSGYQQYKEQEDAKIT